VHQTRCAMVSLPLLMYPRDEADGRVAFMFTGCFMGLAYLVASNDALKIFDYFVSSVTIFGSLTWVSWTAHRRARCWC
jgi:amino acid permease